MKRCQILKGVFRIYILLTGGQVLSGEDKRKRAKGSGPPRMEQQPPYSFRSLKSKKLIPNYLV